MRIISGKYGGRQLETPSKKSIHPMGERIRGAIFNSLLGKLDNATILDAFAGSGAVGLEALSRGAQKVTFIDNDRAALLAIQTNLANLDVPPANFEVISTTVLNWLAKQESLPVFDLVFADPPYHNLQNTSVLALAAVLKPGGQLILSQPKSAPLLEIPGLKLINNRTYADARITWWQKD